MGGGLPREPAAFRVVRRHQQRAAVTLGERPGLDQHERLVGQLEQSEQVGDRDAGTTHAAADVLTRQPELLDEHRHGAGGFERVEVLARHVLDQCELERLGVVVRPDQRRHGLEAGELRRPPAALARDQLVGAARARAHEDGLQHPLAFSDEASATSGSSLNVRRG